MLTVCDLAKRYGQTIALDGVDLDVAVGEVVALLGPNGAGKTTLVSIVAGLRRADAGSVHVGDVDALARPQRARRLLGLAPQDLGLYPLVTVAQNLKLFGELAGLRGKQLRTEVDEVAAALSIDDLLGQVAGTLSGGQKRRLHTAIALLGRPPLLLLDEPTAGADVATRRDLLALVRRLAEEGTAVLYSTHYLHEVEQLDASVVIIEDGRVLARGAVRELLAAHATSAVELSFDGPAPALSLPDPAEVTVDGALVRVIHPDPTATAVAALDALGDDRRRLRSLEVVRPNLESVYLSLTGRRYTPDSDTEARSDPEAGVSSGVSEAGHDLTA